MRMQWTIVTLGLVLALPAVGFAAALDEPAGGPAAAAARTAVQAPVTVNGQAIFTVPGVLSFSAQERAAAISMRIHDLSQDVTIKPESLTVSDAEGTSDIVAGDLVLMSVTDQDAKVAGKPRLQLAQEREQIILTTLVGLRQRYSVRSLVLGSVYALVVTAVLWLVFWMMGYLFPRLYTKLDTGRGTVIPSLRIQKFELLPADRIADFAIGVAKLLRLAVSLVIVYFYLSLVLGFFPWTHGYARILLGYVLSPLRLVGETMLGYLPNIFYILVIAVVARYAIKLTRILFVEVGKQTITLPGFHVDWAEPTYKIVRFLLLVLAAIAVFPYLPGSKSPAFQGISIFIGVLFSLGSTSAVANVVAGTILTYMRAFQLGDRVQIVDTVGDVIEVSLLVTRIRTIKNVEITIANSLVLGSHIVNFSTSARNEGLILHTEVTIGYDAPWRQVHQLLIDAALEIDEVLRTPGPFVLQTALDDFYVHYQLNAYTDKPSTMAQTYSILHQKIQDKFNEAGVEIMSPHAGTMRDGNRVAIPDSYLPKGYVAPSFRVGMGGMPEGVGSDAGEQPE